MCAAYVHALPAGTVVGGYRIEETLGAGGFGITCRAVQVEFGQTVALKEYYPRGAVQRAARGFAIEPVGTEEARELADGLDRFLGEARTLAALMHENVARIHHFFRANGTAYLAMEHVEGESLAARLARAGALGQREIEAFLPGLLAGLRAVHAAGFLHRDLKPHNVMLRAGSGAPVLIDFGAARAAASGSFRTLTAIYSPGFTAPEQYSIDGAQGPWSDLYSLGATLYACLAGAVPVDAMARLHGLSMGQADPLEPARRRWRGRAGDTFLSAVDYALRLKDAERPRRVADFENALAGTRAAAMPTRQSEATRLPPPPPDPPRRRGGIGWLAAFALIAGIGIWGWRAGWLVPTDAGNAPKRQAEMSKPVPQNVPRTAPPQPQPNAEDERLARDADQAPYPGRSLQDCVQCPIMVTLPTGSFTMGSPMGEAGRTRSEGPQVRVTIARWISIGRHEVTYSEFDFCVRAGGCKALLGRLDWERDRQPVTALSWDEAMSYVSWLSARTKRRYRLPAEAEWEYAARAGTTTPFAGGHALSSHDANVDGTKPYGGAATGPKRERTTAVGTFAPNRFGLYDMHGNVWEWTADCWTPNLAGMPTDGRARTDGDCGFRAIRGGSFDNGAVHARSAERIRLQTDRAPGNVGFRVVREH